MWGFKEKPAFSAISQKLALALADERGLTGEAAAPLRMMEQRGRYANRKVTFFRVFDPANVAVAGINPRRFNDLNASAMLYRGHVESDGQVMLNR